MARILIIDDSPVIRSLLTDFLSDLGHDVESRDNGLDGIKRAKEIDFDLCICDTHLPRANGFDVVNDLAHSRPDIKLIFTDSLPDQLSEKIQQIGDYPCLRKPFELSQLKKVLNSMLKGIETR